MIWWQSCTYTVATLFFLFQFPTPSVAESFDCKPSVDGTKFNLTALAGEHVANQTRDSPPTSTVDSLRFNLCAELEMQDGVGEQDQCISGTRACLTRVNRKDGEKDRIISVIPLMSDLRQNLTFKAGLSAPKYISIISTAPEYPHPIYNTPTHQSLNLTLLCSPEETSQPLFKSYDGRTLVIEWSVPAGCPLQEDSDGSDNENDDNSNPSHESAGSGIGWFIFVLLFAFAAYLALGAYYNYSTYGARGADLIPHRDFWKELPYMLSDVISHLCSSVRPRHSSNRGYIAV